MNWESSNFPLEKTFVQRFRALLLSTEEAAPLFLYYDILRQNYQARNQTFEWWLNNNYILAL